MSRLYKGRSTIHMHAHTQSGIMFLNLRTANKTWQFQNHQKGKKNSPTRDTNHFKLLTKWYFKVLKDINNSFLNHLSITFYTQVNYHLNILKKFSESLLPNGIFWVHSQSTWAKIEITPNRGTILWKVRVSK